MALFARRNIRGTISLLLAFLLGSAVTSVLFFSSSFQDIWCNNELSAFATKSHHIAPTRRGDSGNSTNSKLELAAGSHFFYGSQNKQKKSTDPPNR